MKSRSIARRKEKGDVWDDNWRHNNHSTALEFVHIGALSADVLTYYNKQDSWDYKKSVIAEGVVGVKDSARDEQSKAEEHWDNEKDDIVLGVRREAAEFVTAFVEGFLVLWVMEEKRERIDAVFEVGAHSLNRLLRKMMYKALIISFYPLFQ